MKKSARVYWLIPAKPKRELFRQIICILAQQFDASVFEPHLTLLVIAEDGQPRNNRGSRTLSESASKILRQLKTKPIRLQIRGVGFSTKFTKTLFVRFKSNDALKKLIVDLRHAAKSRGKFVRDPHLSLLYQKIPAAVKKELASTIMLPFREVTFDSIKAVHCQLPVRDRADVQAWRVVTSRSLAE